MEAEGVPDDYVPWSVMMPVIVHVEDPEGFPVTVGLPYVAAGSKEAVRTTAIFVAAKAAHDALEFHKSQQKDLQIANLRNLLYEPPLVRFKCEECGNTWDAWVDDEGLLEDRWSVVCTNDRCSHHGYPAMLLPQGQ